MTNWRPDPSRLPRPAYLSLAEQIAQAIRDGKLQGGAQLPPHRKLADDLKLSPFLRWESFNTGRRYADLGPGLTPAGLPTESVTTAGASLFFGDGLVFKADYQWLQRADADRLNLGLGWSF